MTKIDIGNQMTGYLAAPEQSPASVIIVLQEIFGVNKVMRDICDRLAKQGFYALCPDLFWRIEPNIDITDQNQEDLNKAFDLFGKFDIEKGIEDIALAVKTAHRLDGADGKVGAIGFCLGGQLAYLSAAHCDIDVAVGFYGVNIQNHLELAKGISAPLMLHMAGQDQFVPKEAQEQVSAALEEYKHMKLYHYPDRDHAFARMGGEHYHKEDASLAWQRSLDFLRSHLG